jgi:LuxR family maltose regulon positive regulatory protein
MDSSPLFLIQTKLYRPVISGELVRRQRLLDLLDSGRNLPLTLVTAPAGSGKTTLLSDWLAGCPCPSAWLSIDEGDGELTVFLSYLVAAIRTVFPDACQELRALLAAPELPPQRVLEAVLINEIDSLRLPEEILAGGQRFVLVLDDYHLLHSQAVDALLMALLRHPPAGLRLVLASRSDPALPLPTMRARQQMLEIRLQDLRFTGEETTAFLRQALSAPVSAELVAALEQRTEGWIAGLHLASLYLRHAPRTGAALEPADAIGVDDRYVMDYLVDEVLARQPERVQEFLLKTAILDRLCGPLCAAVTGLDDPVCDGQAYLEWLEDNSLFVVSLDERRWFRYHHLFQRLLRNRLEQRFSAAEIARLHERASGWYASRGFVEEAIDHALAAGNEAAAVGLIEAHRHEAMNQEHWAQLERWRRLMSPQLIERRPELQLLEAWILHKQWRFTDLPPYLDRAEALLAAEDSSPADTAVMYSELDTLRALVSYYTQDGDRTFTLAQRALQTLPMHYSTARGTAWMYCGGGLQLMGDIEAAFEAFHEGLKEDRFHGNAFPSRVLTALCVLSWMRADVAGLHRTAAYFLELAEQRNLPESVSWARYFRGCAAYETNDLAAAEDDFAAVLARRYITHSLSYANSAIGLTSIYQAQGAEDKANAVVESLLGYALELNNTRVLADAQAFRAWLALQQGRDAEAQHWADSMDRTAPLTPLTTFHVPALSLAKVMLSQKTPAGRREASVYLARLRSSAESQHATRTLIEVLALQALLADAVGDNRAALEATARAVDLAEPGGMMRVFVDLGPRMAHLLTQHTRSHGASGYLDRVLRASSSSPATPSRSQPLAQPPRPAVLIEPLTLREGEIIELLAERLSAKEIAQRLVISDRTVKRHCANIYQKLGVNSRREAIEAASALGILRMV